MGDLGGPDARGDIEEQEEYLTQSVLRSLTKREAAQPQRGMSGKQGCSRYFWGEEESRKIEKTCCGVIEKKPERLRSWSGKACPLAMEAVTELESKEMERFTSFNPSQREVSGYWHLKKASFALKRMLWKSFGEIPDGGGLDFR